MEKKKSRIVGLAFEKYVKGNMRLEDVSNFLAKSGVTTRTGKRISKTKASFILSNPFYIRLFKYGGEIHEGKHEPIISKQLFTGYLDQVINEQDYRNQKAKLLSEKKSLEEEIFNFSHKQNDWFAPFRNWLKDAQSLDKIASDSDLFAKKVCAKEIFGSHLLLGEKTLRACAPEILNSFGEFGGNPWDALRTSHLLASQKPFSSFVVGDGGLEPPTSTMSM